MTPPELLLKTCNIAECGAMCCHDGVYLSEVEEQRLRQLVDSTPELRARLPAEYVIDGWWNGEHLGRKTATRLHEYRNPAWPAHFPRTRCVFAGEAGLCELQKLGLQRRQHPWRYKPFTCWMFPLDEVDGKALPPSPDPTRDPYRTADYPGFVSAVPCGRHDAAGEPWQRALAHELRHFEAVKALAEFGSLAQSAVS
jgi:hypothetical protein